jgi:hypothetical protein
MMRVINRSISKIENSALNSIYVLEFTALPLVIRRYELWIKSQSNNMSYFKLLDNSVNMGNVDMSDNTIYDALPTATDTYNI